MDMTRTIRSISAIRLFKAFPELKSFYRRRGGPWSRGSFVSTVGKVSESVIREYIQDQKGEK
jgi:putative transposase